MEYKIIDSALWTYPDIWEYPAASDSYSGTAILGGRATFRIIIRGFSGCVRISHRGFDADIFEEIAIPVEDNPNFEEGFLPHFPERIAPFKVYDCMKPCGGIIEKKNEVNSVYVSVKADSEHTCGGISLLADGESVTFPVEIRAYGKMPDETLKISMGYTPWEVAQKHHLEYLSDEFAEMDGKYLKMLRYQHQNGFFLEPERAFMDENGKWHFDFSEMNRRIAQLMKLGFKYFHLPAVGFRKAWDAPEIIIRGTMDALSFEAYEFLSTYLPALRENLRKNGWLDGEHFMMGIADEPNRFNALTYRAVACMVRKYLPEIPIYDAVSYVPVYGAIDIWVPRADEYAKNREIFDIFKKDGDEIWHYVCLYPRDGGYINRFMDIPLLATRYIYWANYKYNLSGYLHWSVNNYQCGLDPYKGSCPEHINAGSKSILPPGDDKLIYPGDGEPYMSARLEAQREAAEEYEMLRIIAEHDKPTADELCESCFRSYTDVEFDVEKFRKTRDRIIMEYGKYC